MPIKWIQKKLGTDDNKVADDSPSIPIESHEVPSELTQVLEQYEAESGEDHTKDR
ncbi:hypothetical protein [Ferrimonas marina]|uniref:Uncharacterized protein n=1 Tax=Ferrimonas marina TaxID=299255 RepID=A0A1M5S6Z1_9GAMM|nr:hypothetical protein [Ferrimonas marina]SHH34274.1 hypothetical protein SAMN02745129_1892 [Ferrimonas marina]